MADWGAAAYAAPLRSHGNPMVEFQRRNTAQGRVFTGERYPEIVEMGSYVEGWIAQADKDDWPLANIFSAHWGAHSVERLLFPEGLTVEAIEHGNGVWFRPLDRAAIVAVLAQCVASQRPIADRVGSWASLFAAGSAEKASDAKREGEGLEIFQQQQDGYIIGARYFAGFSLSPRDGSVVWFAPPAPADLVTADDESSGRQCLSHCQSSPSTSRLPDEKKNEKCDEDDVVGNQPLARHLGRLSFEQLLHAWSHCPPEWTPEAVVEVEESRRLLIAYIENSTNSRNCKPSPLDTPADRSKTNSNVRPTLASSPHRQFAQRTQPVH